MKRIVLLLSLIGTSAVAQGFQMLDRVDGWVIERKLDGQQNQVCRASVPGGGSWFSARIHLDPSDALVVPEGLSAPSKASLESAREALRLCRSSLLYF
jgi:hypothetical protein